METIEERAREVMKTYQFDEEHHSLEVVCRRLYIQGAKEQQEIDIRRATDKMKGILSMPIMKYITKSDVQPLLDELVKAMKGE